MENTKKVLPKAKRDFTDSIIGNGWKHTDKNGREYINISYNQELHIAKGSAMVLKAQAKRSGINPRTGKEFKDGDYMLTAELA